MSAFVDSEATEDIDLPWCVCPNKPHDHDTVTIRTQFGYGDVMQLAKVHTSAGKVDPMAERAKLLELGIRGWSFVGEDGAPVPVGLPMILLLRPSIIEPIAEAIDDAWQKSDEPLPNASSGRSRLSSLASSTALPSRAIRRAAKRSTSKSSSSPAGPSGS